MKEYGLTLRMSIDAHDEDEAIDIAKELEEVLKKHSRYHIRDLEADTIEEL